MNVIADVQKRKEIIVKLLLAALVGGFTGYEREKSNQFAGFRTHILVSVGSCITSITSLLLFFQYSTQTNSDPARLTAQVLSGIGFLGAGAILKTSNGIRGLTTAAGISRRFSGYSADSGILRTYLPGMVSQFELYRFPGNKGCNDSGQHHSLCEMELISDFNTKAAAFSLAAAYF